MAKTIEETIISPIQQRAIDYCDKKQMPKIGRQIAVVAYLHGAQEERERCIKVMQDWYCNNSCIYNEKFGKCPMGSVHACDNILLIRKAMEEGGDHAES